VDRAKFVNEDGELWIFFDEGADGAGRDRDECV